MALFEGYETLAYMPFRVTRNADMEIEEVLDCGSKSVKEKAVNLIKTAMGKNNTAKDNVTMILMEITRSES